MRNFQASTGSIHVVNRGPAIWLTALALALINVGLAGLIVAAIGTNSFAPLWVSLLVMGLGAIAAVGAVVLWRQYLAGSRGF